MPDGSSFRDDSPWRKVPLSDLKALVELFSSLYVPGLTSLGEDQAHDLQSGARTALRRLQADPSGADLSLDVDNPDQPWRSLPVPDQRIYAEYVRQLCQALVSAEGVQAVDQVMQEHYVQVASWSRTADLWERLGGNPVTLVFPGDGPVLRFGAEFEETSGETSSAVKWVVRAASQTAEDEWLVAAKRVTPAGTRFLNLMITDPRTMGFPDRWIPFPIRVPLRGLLGRVRVGSRELDQWEISVPLSYTVGHRFWNGNAVVLHAPDPSEQVVWVTTVQLVEHVRPVPKGRAGREISERPPAKLKFKPFR